MIIDKKDKVYSLPEAIEQREKLTKELNELILFEQDRIKKSNTVKLDSLAEKFKELTEINKIVSEKQEEALKKKKCCTKGSWFGKNAKIGTWAAVGLQAIFGLGSVAISIYVYKEQRGNSKCDKQGPALLAELVSNIVFTFFGAIVVEGVRELSNQSDHNEILKKIDGINDQGEKNVQKIIEVFKNFENNSNRLHFALGCHFIKSLQEHTLGKDLDPNIWISHMLEQLSEKDIEVKNKMQELKKAAKELNKKEISVISNNSSPPKKPSQIETEFHNTTIYLGSSDDSFNGEKNAFNFTTDKKSFFIEEESEGQINFQRLWNSFEEDLGVEGINTIKLGKNLISKEGEIKKKEKSEEILEMN